jgi:hypothetical protein
VHLRAWIFTLLLILLLNLPLHEPIVQKDPWLELEKGLRLCGVETITYQIHCFISESEKERIVSAGVAPLKKEVTDLSDCCWSMQEGYENGEILLEICGTDRVACERLWNRVAELTNCRRGTVARAWSVEAYHSGGQDLTVLGKNLVNALGGRLQKINTYPRMVQLLAHLPWAGEGVLLDDGPVNLSLELYEDRYREKIKIRLGIPVILSLSSALQEGTASWISF